jgi:hypothetical protein
MGGVSSLAPHHFLDKRVLFRLHCSIRAFVCSDHPKRSLVGMIVLQRREC